MSQPTKRTPAMAKKILACANEGLSVRVTAGACGVDPSFIMEWRNEDPAFGARYKRAVSAGERALVKTVRGGNTDSKSGPNWTAAAWLLSRRFPERWGKKREEHRPEAPGLSAEMQAKIAALIPNPEEPPSGA